MSDFTVGRLAAIVFVPLLALLLVLPHLLTIHGENVVCSSGAASFRHTWVAVVGIGVAVAIVADITYAITLRWVAGVMAFTAGALTFIANLVFWFAYSGYCA
jgi:hypothetical protein